MKWIIRTSTWIKARFENVWTEKYPFWWHFIDLFCGIVFGITMAVTFDASVGIKIALFFGVTLFGYLFTFAFTYGIVRARNGWTKKRK